MRIFNFKFQISNSESGFIFLEMIMAISLISIVFITLLGIGFSTLQLSTIIRGASKADSLAKEEIEAIRTFRDGTTWTTNGIATATTGGSNYYYFSKDNTTNPPSWKMNSGTETVGIFIRKVVFDKVSRDPTTKNIESVYNAAHDDPDTRQITVTITYRGKTMRVVTHLTNWQK